MLTGRRIKAAQLYAAQNKSLCVPVLVKAKINSLFNDAFKISFEGGLVLNRQHINPPLIRTQSEILC